MVTKPATVRFYVDADIAGVAKVLAALRSDVTYAGDAGATIHRRVRPPCPIDDPATDDDVWIPAVAAQDWMIITRDAKIQEHTAEINAVMTAGAKMVCLSGIEARTKWLQLETLFSQWRRIDGLFDFPGPFIYTATRTSLRKLV